MNNNLADILKINPLMRFAKVTYSYTQEYGSDGCWCDTETGTCTVDEWMTGAVHNRHTGNRSYNFRLVSIEEVSLETLKARYLADKAERDEKARKEFAANVKRKADADAFKARIAAAVGRTVTVKKKEGKVERAMESRFDAGKVAVLVRFADGSKKWHSEGAVKFTA